MARPLLVLAAVLACAAPAPAQTLTLTADAFARDGRLAYREWHEFTLENDLKAVSSTEYRDTDGRVFAKMDADYRQFPFAPRYRMVDYRHGWDMEATRTADRITMVVRERGREKRKTLPLGTDRELVIGPGFNNLIRARWDRLTAGQTVAVDLALPNRLQVIGFKIARDATRTPGVERFKVTADNAFVALFAPTIYVEYDAQTRFLRAYDGLTNVTDAKDRGLNVLLKYQPVQPATAASQDDE
jgi:hypothetical protein